MHVYIYVRSCVRERRVRRRARGNPFAIRKRAHVLRNTFWLFYPPPPHPLHPHSRRPGPAPNSGRALLLCPRTYYRVRARACVCVRVCIECCNTLPNPVATLLYPRRVRARGFYGLGKKGIMILSIPFRFFFFFTSVVFLLFILFFFFHPDEGGRSGREDEEEEDCCSTIGFHTQKHTYTRGQREHHDTSLYGTTKNQKKK